MNNSKKHLALSTVQNEVERIVRQKFSKKAIKKRFYFDKNKKNEFIEIDGYLEKPRTFIEIWAHIGKPKSAQKTKVVADALKLLFAEEKFGQGETDKFLLFVDDEAINHFLGGSWHSRALQNFGFKLRKIEIEDKLKKELLEAQERQGRGNQKKLTKKIII